MSLLKHGLFLLRGCEGPPGRVLRVGLGGKKNHVVCKNTRMINKRSKCHVKNEFLCKENEKQQLKFVVVLCNIHLSE